MCIRDSFIPMLLVQFGKLFDGINVQLKIDNRENILGMLALSLIHISEPTRPY